MQRSGEASSRGMRYGDVECLVGKHVIAAHCGVKEKRCGERQSFEASQQSEVRGASERRRAKKCEERQSGAAERSARSVTERRGVAAGKTASTAAAGYSDAKVTLRWGPVSGVPCGGVPSVGSHWVGSHWVGSHQSLGPPPQSAVSAADDAPR